MNPIIISQSEQEARRAIGYMLNVQTHQEDIERLKRAHRALRDMPPEWTFIGNGSKQAISQKGGSVA